MIARVATHPQRLAGDETRLVGESDSYACAIGRPDRDDRIVAEGLAADASRLGAKQSLKPRGARQPLVSNEGNTTGDTPPRFVCSDCLAEKGARRYPRTGVEAVVADSNR